MTFTNPLFSDSLSDDMAGGPTVFGFSNPDGTSGPDSGVVPGPSAPNAGVAVSTGAATVHLTAQSGTGSDPATITMLNTVITAVNAALTILDANTVKGNTNGSAIEILNQWAIDSGYIKPPVA